MIRLVCQLPKTLQLYRFQLAKAEKDIRERAPTDLEKMSGHVEKKNLCALPINVAE